MSGPSDLDDLAAEFGILPEFHDLSGAPRPTSPETKRALLRANGIAADSDAAISEALAARRAARNDRMLPREMVVVSGTPLDLAVPRGGDWQLELEGRPGDALEGNCGDRLVLPPLPSGVHTLTLGAEQVELIAAPASCPSLEAATGRARIWGVNAALYGLRSSRNRGLGDFEDLARAAEAIGAHGADFLGINPVHNIGWCERGTISPYSPSHRAFLNTANIATDRLGAPPESHGANPGESIDYAGFLSDHCETLEALYRSAETAESAAFEAFCTDRGEALARFATFEALSEVHGHDWRHWPGHLQDAATARADPDDRVRFHCWLQWVAETQLADAQSRARGAGMGLGLYLDLAVGPRRGGAETWCEREAIAEGVSIGAPPDHLSPDGQNWGLAAWSPSKLAQQKYRPFRQIVAEVMRHAGVLRIDHVLGLNRSYWIPDDGSPGGYIRQPLETLLALIAIEAERAGTVVIGEDLGLVPEGFREALAARGLYGYSVLQYERDGEGRLREPQTVRPHSLLCFGTHDTPTLRGFWEGRDIDWWRRLDWIDDGQAGAAHAQRERDREALLTTGSSPLPDARDYPAAKRRIHEAMASSPVAMVSVQLDDLCDRVEAQNLPGTIDEHPNWRRRCPLPVEGLHDDPGLRETGETMRHGGRANHSGGSA